MDNLRPTSRYLVADIGSAVTHVRLLDNVEGSYRLVARGDTASTPNDVVQGIMAGLIQAIRQIERTVQYPFLDALNELISPELHDETIPVSFYASSSTAPPLRVLILGLSGTFSIASARRACLLPVVEIVGAFELDNNLSDDDDSWSTLNQLHPEVIVLVGGFDSYSSEPWETCARRLQSLYVKTSRDQNPIMVFGGNSASASELGNILASTFYLRTVVNTRPGRDAERLDNLRHELFRIYEQTKLSRLTGYSRLLKWCATPPQATCHTLENLFRYLASQAGPDQVVMGIDVGASNTLHFLQAGLTAPTVFGIHEGSAYYRGINDDAIRRWLPLSINNEKDLLNAIHDTGLPAPFLKDMPSMLAALGVAHEAILESKQCWQEISDDGAPPTCEGIDRMYIRGGVLLHAFDTSLSLLTLLDTLQPTGITQVFMDWAEIWPQLGMVAEIAPQAASEVLEQDGLSLLGTLIAPIGSVHKQDQALRLTITRTNGQREDHSIAGGIIKRLVYPTDEVLDITVKAGFAWDLGYGRGCSVKVSVRSGSLGIIMDTRGRPLSHTKLGLLWRTRVDADILALTSPMRLMYPQSTLKRGQ